MWYRIIIKQITNVKWIRHENKLQLFRLIGTTRPCALLTALRKRAKWRQRSSFGQSLVQSLQMTTISGQKSESFYLPPPPFSILFFSHSMLFLGLASKSSFVVIFVAPLRGFDHKSNVCNLLDSTHIVFL